MTRALLDVNVLIALFDSDHVDHRRVRQWLDSEIVHGWASCAITQNGFIRIVSQPRYPSPVTPTQAIERLTHATDTVHHEYWPCSISLLDTKLFDHSKLHGHRQVTDAYLLALATANKAQFVTLDQSIALTAVRHAGPQHLTVI
ncbi:MAG: PIN domain-containing protein [Mycolicibacterium sp.]|nr:PIN domain-containing protein [Mycolicibacterium sp.]